MKFLLATILFALSLAPQASAQSKHVEKKVEKRVEKVESEREVEDEAAQTGEAVEGSANAEPRVAVSVCVASGDVVVRGWDQNVVRARAEGAGSVRLLTPNVQPAPRVEVVISEEKGAELESGDCGSASNVELMVPRGASVNVQARDGHIEVADVSELRVEALSGDVDVRRVSKGIQVSCLNGDISLVDSSGPVRLTTVSGEVEARNVRTVAGGDTFEAKSTSGEVTLEDIAHTQVTGTAVSGNVLYTGTLARGGAYDFKTISGDVTLELPADSSFSLHAKVIVSGDIETDFPVKTAAIASTSTTSSSAPARTQSGARSTPPTVPTGPTGPVGTLPPAPPDVTGVLTSEHDKHGRNRPSRESAQARLDGTVGSGDAVVNLSSFSGSLHLHKR